jgi:hypothetical protein
MLMTNQGNNSCSQTNRFGRIVNRSWQGADIILAYNLDARLFGIGAFDLQEKPPFAMYLFGNLARFLVDLLMPVTAGVGVHF